MASQEGERLSQPDPRLGGSRPPNRQELNGPKLLAFSLPMLPIVAVEMAWRVYLPAHFTGVVGLPLATAGALLMAARMFDLVIDPAIAWASDRYMTRWGHRRPWMVASLAPLTAGTALVFFAAPGMTLPALAAACLLLHLGLMMLATPHGGWAMELGRSTEQRMRIMFAKTWLPIAGAVGLVMLPAILERGWQVDARGQVAGLGWLLLLIAPTAVVLAVALVRESPTAPSRSAPRHPAMLLLGVLRRPDLRPILLLYLVSGFGEAACATIFLLFVTHGLGLPGWGSTMLLLQTASTLIALPAWYRLGTRVGPRRLLATAYASLTIIAPVALLLPAGQPAAAAAFMIVRGLVGGVEFMVLRVLVSEVAGPAADAGPRQGASTYAVSNITLKLAMGGAAWLTLGAVALIDPTAATPGWRPDLAQRLAICACYTAPMLLSGILGLLVLRYAGRTEIAQQRARYSAEELAVPPPAHPASG